MTPEGSLHYVASLLISRVYQFVKVQIINLSLRLAFSQSPVFSGSDCNDISIDASVI